MALSPRAGIRRPGKIARLPEEARSLIGALLKAGCTLDQILAKLRELDIPAEALPGRSVLGKWARQQSAIIEEMQRQAQIGEALVSRYGEAGDNRTARLNIAMAQGLLTRLMFTEEGQMAVFDAKESMFLASAIKSLTGASKDDTDREMKIRADERKKEQEKTAKALQQVSREGGISPETLAEINRALGVQ